MLILEFDTLGNAEHSKRCSSSLLEHLVDWSIFQLKHLPAWSISHLVASFNQEIEKSTSLGRWLARGDNQLEERTNSKRVPVRVPTWRELKLEETSKPPNCKRFRVTKFKINNLNCLPTESFRLGKNRCSSMLYGSPRFCNHSDECAANSFRLKVWSCVDCKTCNARIANAP